MNFEGVIKNPMHKLLIASIALVFLLYPLSPLTVVLAEDVPPETEASQDTTNETGEEVADGTSDGATVISTGDAEVGIEVSNEVNQNEVDQNSTEENSGETGEELGDLLGGTWPCWHFGNCNASDVDIEQDNDAEVTNDAEGEGLTGENEASNEDGTTYIETGDADIGAVTENNVNSNSTEVDCEDDCNDCWKPKEIDVANDNDATTTNDMELDGETGSNEIATSNQAMISTGDIEIFNALVNYINTNFFGEGKEYFINIFNRTIGDLDLSGYGEGYTSLNNDEEGQGGCEVGNCEVNLDNDNDSILDNDINIDANTGLNLIHDAGTSIIETGDIDIINDIANFANINVAGDEWFFAVVNIFGHLEGDIIIPGFEEEELISTQGDGIKEKVLQKKELIVTNTNNAEIIDNINIEGRTGDNLAQAAGDVLINTGDASIDTKSVNLVNLNYIGDKWRLTIINVFGNWEGIVHGLPENYSYYDDGDSITIFNDTFNSDIFYETFRELDVENNNDNLTTNDININANTGANEIANSSGDALIDTGDISISNALLNFINANFIGNAWEFVMVNVFGDWVGNLSFGQPELWIKESPSTRGPIGPGETVTYNFVFGNNGDGIANNVRVIDDFYESLIRVGDIAGGSNGGGLVSWYIGQLPPNSQGSLSYSVQVRDDIPYGESNAPNTVYITSDEADRDESNNSDGDTVVVNGGRSAAQKARFYAVLYGTGPGTNPASLSVIKTNNTGDVIGPGDEVTYTITIKNPGGADLEEVLAEDTMTNGDRTFAINKEFWDLETVKAGEEIVIEYTIQVGKNMPSGTYYNEVIVEGYDSVRDGYINAVASSKIKVENNNIIVEGEEGAPELAVEKSTETEYANPGDEVEYTVKIINNGNLTAYGVELTETLADNLTFTDKDGKIGRWEIGDMDPGAQEEVSFTIKVSDSAAAAVYTCISAAAADNHGPVNAISDLEVRVPEVQSVVGHVGGGGDAELVPTGFSILEFALMLILVFSLLVLSRVIRKRYI